MLQAMATRLAGLLEERSCEDPLLIGIHTGGVWLAERLGRVLGVTAPVGTLDVSLYRDDYSSKGLKPEIRATSLPDSTEGRHIVLVDDVIETGRTIRGALNLLFDYGRPASILLVELIDLPERELPIQPDVIGERMTVPDGRRVKLTGPDPLSLVLVDGSEGRD